MADRVVKYVFRGDITDLRAKMTAAGASVTAFGGKLTALDKDGEKMRRGLTTVGDTAGKVGLAAAAGLGATVKAAMDWETAWAGVTKTVDGSAAEMATLEGELRNLATTLPATHDEIAGVAEAAGQLGVAREDIAGFTKTMIDLSETTNLTADEAATSIAQMANVMGTAPDDIDNLGSALVALGNDGASTERDIVQMAQGISGAAAIVGLAEADVLALANATASMGIEVEAGGTAISRVLTDMGKASKQGGEDLERFAAAAGMSADEFATAFEERPAEAFAAFIAGLEGIQASGGDVFTTLDQLGLSDVRVSRALLGMASSGDLLTDSLKLGSEAWKENTALAEEAEKRYATSAAQVQVAWNKIKDAAIDVGGAVLPVVAKVADAVGDMASAFSELPGPVKSATGGLLGLTAIFGGGLWFTSKVINGIVTTKTALTDLGISAGKTKGALQGMAKGVQFVAIIEGVKMLDAALQDLFNENLDTSTLGRSLEALANGNITGTIAETFDKDLSGFGADLAVVTSGVQNFTDTVFGFLPGDTSLDIAERNIKAIDEALAQLVEGGQAGQAAAIFDQLAASAKEQGVSVTELKGQLSQYGTALENTAGATRSSTASTASNTTAIKNNTASLQANIDAMREKRNATIAAENAEIGYQQSIDDARRSLKENGKTLDITTDKGRANRTALLNMAAAWNNQSDAAKNTEGAHRSAIRQFVRTAVQMGMNADKARAYAKRLFEIPSNRSTKVTADTGQALTAINGVMTAMRNIDGTVSQTYIITNRIEKVSRQLGDIGAATGGHILGPGTSTSDSIPARLSDGEYVIRAAAVEKYGVNMFHRLNAMRFAEGGHVQRFATGGAVRASSEPVQRFATGGTVSQFTQRTQAQNPLSRSTVDVALSRQIAAQNRELRELRRVMENLPPNVEAGARRGVGDRNRETTQRRKARR